MAGPSLAFGKIAPLKRSNRLPIFAAGIAGALLIAFGLRMGQGGSAAPAAAPIAPSGEPLGLSFPEPKVDRLSTPKGEPAKSLPQAASNPESPPAKLEPVTVLVQLNYRSDQAAAADANVSLWREETGEGAAYRPARRLSQVQSNAEGAATLTAAPNQALEVYAKAAGNGPMARQRLGPLESGEVRAVRLEVERPPAPMDLEVRDAASGEPVAGAALRIAMISQQNLGLEEFPGTAKLMKRTDGQGRALLPGPARNGKWLLVDAAGYSPTAVDLRMLDGIGSPEVALHQAARVNALVTNGAGEVQRDISVQFVAQLGNFRCTFTAVTNGRGEATFPRLPASIPLVPHAGPIDDVPALFDAVQLEPGEERQLALKL